MKLLKGSLFVVATLMAHSVSAKERIRKAGTTPRKPNIENMQQTPKSDGNIRKIMQYLRTSKSSGDIIDKDGSISPKFEKMLTDHNPSKVSILGLTEAARNLHMPLSGDTTQDLELISNIEKIYRDYLVEEEQDNIDDDIVPMEKPQDTLEEYIRTAFITGDQVIADFAQNTNPGPVYNQMEALVKLVVMDLPEGFKNAPKKEIKAAVLNVIDQQLLNHPNRVEVALRVGEMLDSI